RPGVTRDEVDTQLAEMEEALMNRRNRSWIPVIEAAAKDGPVFAAFGALHLSGEEGVLALLEREGFAIEQAPFGD
ncbi:MAG: TraB/GumN family protein, partial [Albidovulum sp.]|uniref:TraB/GumN family protein n=1 Tax=Albidovulum sp. TaxID=1872424 RepID=UPI003C86E1B9